MAAADPRRCSHRRCALASCCSRYAETPSRSGSSIPCVLLGFVEHAFKASVDARTHRQSSVARLDLDGLGVRVETRLPVDDAVAARVYGDRSGARPKRSPQITAEALTAGALCAARGEH